MSHRNAEASNARLLKAVAAETEQAPDWIQAGKEVYSPRHGTGHHYHLHQRRHPMQAVFNAPVGTNCISNFSGITRQTADIVAGFATGLPVESPLGSFDCVSAKDSA